MKYLFKGMLGHDEFNHLYMMSSLRSDTINNALYHYLVVGLSEDIVCLQDGLSQSNFNRDLNKLEQLYSQIQKYNEIIGVVRIT